MTRDNQQQDMDPDLMDKHPGALDDSERRSIKGKHILMTTLKWAGIGALGLGAAAAIAPVAFGGSLAMALPWYAKIPFVGGWMTNLFPAPMNAAMGFIGNTALSWGTSGAMLGAAGAGLVGLIKGISGADDAVDDAEEDKMAKYDRAQNRQRKLAALRQMQQQQMGNMRAMEEQYGLSQAGLPRLRSTERGIETI